MNSAKTKTNQDHDHDQVILSPCHQPDKLIETDVTVAVLNQFVREFIYLIYHIYMAIKI